MRYFLSSCFFLPVFISISIAQPSNDHCENAIRLDSTNGGCFYNATLLHATQSLSAGDCNSALVQDVWFSFQAKNKEHNVSLNPTEGMDGVVEVRKGNACNGSYVACVDMGGVMGLLKI